MANEDMAAAYAAATKAIARASNFAAAWLDAGLAKESNASSIRTAWATGALAAAGLGMLGLAALQAVQVLQAMGAEREQVQALIAELTKTRAELSKARTATTNPNGDEGR